MKNIKKLPRILQPKSEYIVEYPMAVEYAKEQNHIVWFEDEIEMEKDLHDLKTNLSEAELHGVTTVLKLFTKYEISVNEYWSGRLAKIFKRPADITRMCNCFSYFEVNVHAPFYAKINELLGLATNEFYNSYIENPTLKDRIDWIDSVIALPTNNIKDILKSIGAFSMVEGAVLYSSFAFLKHFQSEGKNKLTNLIAGIDFSVKDEQKHSEAGAWLYRTLLSESVEDGLLTKDDLLEIEETMIKTANKTYEHESVIVDMIFEKGHIKGVTDKQLNNFVQSRVDLCLENLGYEKIFNPDYNPIKSWFYNSISSGGKMHDFFVSIGSSYNRDWKETGFKWRLDGEKSYQEEQTEKNNLEGEEIV